MNKLVPSSSSHCSVPLASKIVQISLLFFSEHCCIRLCCVAVATKIRCRIPS